jgi:hypothetical protein
VTAFDGTDDGTVLSDTIVIDNTAPTLTSVTITPDPAVASDTLTCTPSGAYDADGDSTTVEYEWTVEGVYMGSTNTLVGLFVAGNLVACRGTISDGTETGITVTTSTTIGNTPPEAPVISIIPAAPIAGEDDLVCNVDVASYDVDGDSVTYSFDWEVDGGSYGGTPTTATMSSTIPGTDTNGGETWTCAVMPNDGDEDGASSSASVVIEELEPGPALSCLDILESGDSTGDGTYWIDPDGTGAFEVYCDMTMDAGGWTLMARYRDGSTMDFDISTNQVQGGGMVGTPPVLDPGGETYGHMRYSYFNPIAASVRMECGINGGGSILSLIYDDLFTDWDDGTKGTYGDGAWGIVGSNGYYRGDHYMCGEFEYEDGGPEYRGIATCSGTGYHLDWSNHRVSFNNWSAGNTNLIGCDGVQQDNGYVMVWIR